LSALKELTGLGHIIVTPFWPDESLDLDSLRSAVNFAIEGGARAIVALGIMGEAGKLTDAERDQVVATVAEHSARRVPVLAGCTAESTAATVWRIAAAAAHGADGAMVALPRAAGSSELQLEHYARVANESALPILLQDEPVSTGVTLSAATIAAILGDERVFAVKEEHTPTPTKVSQVLAQRPDARVFGGHGGQFLLEELDRGAVGTMTGFAVPSVLARVCELFAAGDRDGAQEVFFRALPLIRYEAQLGPGGVAIRKQLLAERGVISGATVRGPSAPVDPRALGELRNLVSQSVESQ
jgi:4-hydroxy-tetrahydrodipicolinate synthase